MTKTLNILIINNKRFIAEYILDNRFITRFIFALFPHKPPYRLTMD